MKRFTLCTAAFLWMLAGCSVKPSPSIQQPEKKSAVFIREPPGEQRRNPCRNYAGSRFNKNIEVLDHQETKGISDLPLTVIPEQIVKTQSIAVEALSGATMTSNGIKNAVKNALEEAAGETAGKSNLKSQG